MAYYPIDEQETTILYERAAKIYTVYSTVPHHIRRMVKKSSLFTLKTVEYNEDMSIKALKVTYLKLPPFSTFR